MLSERNVEETREGWQTMRHTHAVYVDRLTGSFWWLTDGMEWTKYTHAYTTMSWWNWESSISLFLNSLSVWPDYETVESTGTSCHNDVVCSSRLIAETRTIYLAWRRWWFPDGAKLRHHIRMRRRHDVVSISIIINMWIKNYDWIYQSNRLTKAPIKIKDERLLTTSCSMLFIEDSAGTSRTALSSNRAAQRCRHLATSPEAMMPYSSSN